MNKLLIALIAPLVISSCTETNDFSSYQLKEDSFLCFKNSYTTMQKDEKLNLKDLIVASVNIDDIVFKNKDNKKLIIEDGYTINPKSVGETTLVAVNKNNDTLIDKLKISIVDYPLANGQYSFEDVYKNKEQTFELYSVLEQYVINNHLMGIPLYGIKDMALDNLGHYNFVKLYVNGCNDELRNSVFDSDVQQKYDTPYLSKPILQNANFYDGLIACINRQELVERNHKNENTFSTLVSFDRYDRVPIGYDFPITGIGEEEELIIKEGAHYSLLDYVGSDSYKNNFKALLYDANQYGYSLDKAKFLFNRATDELIASKAYSVGEEIVLEMSASASEYEWLPLIDYQLVAKYIEDAFNSATDKLKLKINIIENNYAYPDSTMSISGRYDFFSNFVTSFWWPEDFHPLSTFKRSETECVTALNTFQNVRTNEKADILYRGERFSFSALVVFAFSKVTSKGSFSSASIKNGLLDVGVVE